MKQILNYITIEKEAHWQYKLTSVALHGLPPAVVLQMQGCERSKSAKGQKLCYLMESQIDSIYGTEKKICFISIFLIPSRIGISLLCLFFLHNIAYNISMLPYAVCHNLKSVFNFYCSGGIPNVTKKDNVRQNGPCMEQHYRDRYRSVI